MREAYRPRDQLVEDGGLKLQPEEFRIMREQGGIQIALDRGQVERVVLKTGMVAHYQKRKNGQQGQQEQIRRGKVARAQWTRARVYGRLCHFKYLEIEEESDLSPLRSWLISDLRFPRFAPPSTSSDRLSPLKKID
jgi:hypothetical protein